MKVLNLKNSKGFTLLEMTLVLVVAASILVMILGYVTQKSTELRRDRTSLQIQQILNAALAYYVDNGTWPVPQCTAGGGGGGGNCGCGSWFDLTTLQQSGYLLPSTASLVSPWGQGYLVSCNDKVTTGGGGGGGSATTKQITGTFSVQTNVTNPNEAVIIAGRLPFGFVSDSDGSALSPPTAGSCTLTPPYANTCTMVLSSVSIPGQNLNNARSINFAGIYNNGACVPAPVCPGGMKPQIFVTPTQVNGNWNINNSSALYPIESFAAFARGKNYAGDPGLNNEVFDCEVVTNPPTPTGGGAPRICNSFSGMYGEPTVPATGKPADPANTLYWRVCLAIVTEAGRITFPNSSTQQGLFPEGVQQGLNMGTIMVLTRCVPTDTNGKPYEYPSGSPFGYFEPNQTSNP